MEFSEMRLPGCWEIQPRVLEDDRGRFVKTFHEETFAAHGLATNFVEDYYSISHAGVLRGLHFQLPPHEHAKLVHCIAGSVMDVIVDLRLGSPTYGSHAVVQLRAEQCNLVYLPPGVAHGFYVSAGDATLVYKVTHAYAAESDTGILWSSTDVAWPNRNPRVSERDRTFPRLEEFLSPFHYESALAHQEGVTNDA